MFGKPPKIGVWVSTKTDNLVNQRNKAKQKYKQSKTPAAKNNWRKIAREVAESYKKDEARY